MTAPKTRNENIVVQEIDNEILIYDLKTNKAFCLNETSAIIYQLCDGKRTVAEISQALNQTLKQKINEDLIWLALNDFKKDNLLENSEQFEISFNGLNRRQVIKKIGFASMIALPVVSSVVAPSAAMAASGLALFGVCSGPFNSQSNCAPGLICYNCIGNPCPNGLGPTCCQPNGNISSVFGPGSLMGVCPSSQSFCNACSSQCCSGTTVFTNGVCSCV